MSKLEKELSKYGNSIEKNGYIYMHPKSLIQSLSKLK